MILIQEKTKNNVLHELILDATKKLHTSIYVTVFHVPTQQIHEYKPFKTIEEAKAFLLNWGDK
ncbi:MAG TPA: hypothetical protein VN698_10390 [Bacteroidia bacterium]|nr:hypothetical protein [Bacteroidia bacterium]